MHFTQYLIPSLNSPTHRNKEQDQTPKKKKLKLKQKRRQNTHIYEVGPTKSNL